MENRSMSDTDHKWLTVWDKYGEIVRIKGDPNMSEEVINAILAAVNAAKDAAITTLDLASGERTNP